jgi:hypothetical protein
MASKADSIGFKVWGADNVVYGPVELPELVTWVQGKRITADTWIFSEKDDKWSKASQLSELGMFYRPKNPSAASTSISGDTVPIAALRRVKILADLSDEDLARFLGFMEVHTARQWAPIVHQGDHGDAMFFVLDGEVRVRLIISGKESTLVTLGPGDFFGEVALFDQGPRSADVVANSDAVLLKISHEAFGRLSEAAPDLAAPFLLGIGKTLTARIRADNKRYRDSIVLARAAQ